jgi:Ca2+/Na+ antiporter
MRRHHSFLGIALFIFLVWLALVVVGHILSWLINLLWILIVIAFIWWLVRVFSGRRSHRDW